MAELKRATLYINKYDPEKREIVELAGESLTNLSISRTSGPTTLRLQYQDQPMIYLGPTIIRKVLS
jgi:hypothetical protein